MKRAKVAERNKPSADARPVEDVRSDFTAAESFARLTDIGRRVVTVPHSEIEKAEQRRKRRGDR